MLLIRNGLVNLNQEWHKVDLLLDMGKIVQISHSITKTPQMQEIDANSQYVIPGFIDMHVHVDDQIGDFYLADTYRSGTEVAIRNGITSFYTFITQQDNETNSDAINKAMRKTDGNLFCNVGFHMTMKPLASAVDLYENPVDGYALHSIKLYTTYKKAGIYTSYDEMEEYFRYFSGKPIVFLIHCEDEAILEQSALSNPHWDGVSDSYPPTRGGIKGGCTSDFELRTYEDGSADADPYSSDFALRTSNFALPNDSRPPSAEVEAIRKVIELAGKYDVRIHIVHVSTPEGLALIEAARSRIKLTCETAPQYLFLNEDMLAAENGHRWLCTPPLRSEEMRKTLHHLAERGKIDAFATDHCAFTKEDKDKNKADYRNVPNGLAGLGSLPHLVYQLNTQDPGETLLFMSRHLSKNPAKILGIFPHKGIITENADADISIVDVHGKAKNVQSSLSDTYEIYPNVKSQLHFSHVILNGHPVVKDNKLLDLNSPKGELL